MSVSPTAAAERVVCVFVGATLAVLYMRARECKRSSRARPDEPKTVTIGGVTVPKESTIRLMTRLAIKHGAVNLSQGFPNEPPPLAMTMAAAGALLAGDTLESAAACATTLAKHFSAEPKAATKDSLNQYSFPFGAPFLRQTIERYYTTFYPTVPANAEDNLTVVLGATEGFAVCLRALCSPGDAVAFFQPFHELYPAQCTLWGLTPRAVTLYESGGAWMFDEASLETALQGAKVLLFNSPHNPTGKVFSETELAMIARLCRKHDVIAVTDEIYEHMCYDGTRHISLAEIDGMAERCCIVNALSKTAKATGWRVGWVVAPKVHTPRIRAVHDQLVLQAPTPLQVGAAAMLAQPRAVFDAIAAEYVPKRNLLIQALQAAGFSVGPTPQGAYYLFVGYRSVKALGSLSPVEAAMKLTSEYKVACVPGDNFYLDEAARSDPQLGGRYLRFTFVRSLDVLEAAAAKLACLI